MILVMKQNLDQLTDEEITLNFRNSVEEAIEKAKEAGLPICGYDDSLNRSYILYPDGRKEYAEA